MLKEKRSFIENRQVCWMSKRLPLHYIRLWYQIFTYSVRISLDPLQGTTAPSATREKFQRVTSINNFSPTAQLFHSAEGSYSHRINCFILAKCDQKTNPSNHKQMWLPMSKCCSQKMKSMYKAPKVSKQACVWMPLLLLKTMCPKTHKKLYLQTIQK